MIKHATNSVAWSEKETYTNCTDSHAHHTDWLTILKKLPTDEYQANSLP